jgi:hypothetical protein
VNGFGKPILMGAEGEIRLTTGRFQAVNGKCIVYDLFISASSNNFAPL